MLTTKNLILFVMKYRISHNIRVTNSKWIYLSRIKFLLDECYYKYRIQIAKAWAYNMIALPLFYINIRAAST